MSRLRYAYLPVLMIALTFHPTSPRSVRLLGFTDADMLWICEKAGEVKLYIFTRPQLVHTVIQRDLDNRFVAENEDGEEYRMLISLVKSPTPGFAGAASEEHRT